jgi:predicted tellurium resistance membrane protein TerC
VLACVGVLQLRPGTTQRFAVTHDAVVIWTANAFALLVLGSLVTLVDLLVYIRPPVS